MQPPILKRSKLPPEQKAIAMRLREERKLEKFSQPELASDSGIGRASLSNYEYGLAALPFGAGIKLCRRLDLNQRWLATGKGEHRPYVPLPDLDLDANVETLYSGTFLDGFRDLIATPMRKWDKEHPPEVLISALLRGSPFKQYARMSMIELERRIREYSAKLREEDRARMKLAVLSHIEAAATELKRRLEATVVTAVS